MSEGGEPKQRGRKLGRAFRLVWLAGIVSSAGDGMFLTAFPLLAAVLTRDPALIAGVTVAGRLPWLLFSLVAGAIADRQDRRRLMVGADIVRGLTVAGLAVSIIAHVDRIWLLYACAFALGLGETIHANAAQAMIPTLVAPEQLTPANAQLTGMQVLAENFVGPPLGAAFFGAAPAIPFLVDAVSFAAAAGLVRAVPYRPAPERPTTRLWADLREGVRFGIRHPVLRRLATLLGVLNFFYFASEAVLILYAFERLHAGKATYTAMFVAAAVGTIATQWLVAPLEARFGSATTVAVSLWLWAIALVGLALTRTPVVAILLFFVLGMGDGLWRVLTVTLRQTITPNRLLGRVNSAYRMVAQGVVPLGAAFGGAIAKSFGVDAPFVVAAVVFLVIAASAPRVLRPIRIWTPEPVASSEAPGH